MTNVRLHIAYDGTEYHGWQEQRDVRTLEGSIRQALLEILDLSESGDLDFQGASRTDAGVHAIGQVANLRFDADRELWDFVRGVNALTDDDICVNCADIVDDEFDARHNSSGKTYRYTIWNHRFVHPMLRNHSWQVGKPLDVDAMHRAGQHLLGEHDFESFRASDCQAATSIRDIWDVEVTRDRRTVEIVVRGSAFLMYMVRNIVGTLVEVGVGRMETDAIPGILAALDRNAAGPTAPPSGLTLIEVHYPSDPWASRPGIGVWIDPE